MGVKNNMPQLWSEDGKERVMTKVIGCDKTDCIYHSDRDEYDLNYLCRLDHIRIKDGQCEEYMSIDQLRVGSWIENETTYADNVRQTCECSVCGKRSPRPLGDYCRWCGAKMERRADEPYIKRD